MIRILDTQAPMIIVRNPAHHRLCSLAARIAYDLYLYYRIDSEIITPEEAFDRVAVEKGGLEGNVVVLGRPDENAFTEWMVTQQAIPRECARLSLQVAFFAQDLWNSSISGSESVQT